MSEEAGFNIAGEFYPMPVSFRLVDPVLVGEVTGMSWEEFATLLDSGDPRSLAGMIAVAVWQKHPEWRRDKAAKFVENISMDSIEATGGDADPPPEDSGIITGDSPVPLTRSLEASEASDESSLDSFGVPV